MIDALLKAAAPYRLWLIAGAIVAAIGVAGTAWLTMRADIRKAAVSDAAQSINTEGVANADRIEAGRLAARACHASGRVWNLAAGRCDGKP
jgi:hypothetical protein